eukprot:UN28742
MMIFRSVLQENFLPSWNWNPYLFVLWVLGVILRYLILFPLRVIIIFVSGVINLGLLALWEKLYADDPEKLQEWQLWTLTWSFYWQVVAFIGVIKYHGVIPAKKVNQIYVANHSTMLDILLPLQIAPFCLVGQRHNTKPAVDFAQTRILKSLNCIGSIE